MEHYYGLTLNLGECPDNVSVSKAERYVTALYLAAMTVSTVGYGDVPPQNLSERLYLVFATMIGGGIFAYVTGNVCQVMAGMNVRETEFQAMMDAVNRFIDEAYLSDELADRLRKYVRYKQNASNIKDWKRTLDELSPALRGEVAMELNATQLENVPFFKVCSQEMMIEVSFLLIHLTFPPMENIIRPGEQPDVMYVIKRGLVACVGKVLRRDNVVGEDMLFKSKPRSYSACTLTYVDTLALRKEQLEVILRGFSDTAVQLRRHVVKLLFRDQVHIYVRIVERVVLFALEQRRRARREGRLEGFPAWRDVLILFYYIRLVPDEVQQRMEFPLMLTVLRTVAPKMLVKIEGEVVFVQRRWREHLAAARLSQAGGSALALRMHRLMSFLTSPPPRQTDRTDSRGSDTGGAPAPGASSSRLEGPLSPAARPSEPWRRARVSFQMIAGHESAHGGGGGAAGGSAGLGGAVSLPSLLRDGQGCAAPRPPILPPSAPLAHA